MTSSSELHPLLDHLAQTETPTDHEWNGWRITHITGGWNNLLYRATNADADLAVKFTRRDQRDRAGREFAALTALHQAGLNIAPSPVLLERDRYAQPVVVQTWIDGIVKYAPPETEPEWIRLLQHYAALNQLTPNQTRIELREAVVNAKSAPEGIIRVCEQLNHLPPAAQPESLQRLMECFEATRFPEWQPPRITLCRTDPNITNFVRRADGWMSVDWENAGWGDPAFEIGDLMAHPAYASVSTERWDWVIEQYCNLMNDRAMETQIRTYYRIVLVWWVIRCARYLYEIPLGTDRRLVDRPADWQTDFQAKYEHYLRAAHDAL